MAVTAPHVALVLNGGSSSLKFGLYAIGDGEPVAKFAGEIEGAPGESDLLNRVAAKLSEVGAPAPTIVGHRIVHGGPDLGHHCQIDLGVLTQIEAAAQFAPLHGRASLALIEAANLRYPGVPQIACFDTVFHATLPPVAQVLPLPKAIRDQGIRRYGFHGLSCESILHQLGDNLPERLVIAHLGNGASVTAVRAGRSIDTSMGFTPSGGVMMGMRSGDIDPGTLIHLLRSPAMNATALEKMLDHQSGLIGVSGLSGDMRTLQVASPTNADARLAIEMFCYSVRKEIAGMMSVLGGADMLVFTGGIGENDALVRRMICDGLKWAGLAMAAADESKPGTVCDARVMASREDDEIARHCRDILQGGTRREASLR